MLSWFDPAYTAAVQRFVFPLHERLKGHSTFRILRQMQNDEWLSPLDLRRLQERRLRAFISNAFQSVPYYRDLRLKLGLKGDSIRTVDDLGSLPLLDKTIIRDRLADLRSANAKRIHKFSTGGSTGSPLTFYLGPTRISSDVAGRWRAEGWWGVGLGDRECVIWGSPLELTKQDRFRDLRDRILRTKLMSAFEMSPAVMDSYLDEMEHRGCTRVFGYPSSIALLCEHARRQRRDLSKLGVKVVFVTAEYLWDHWRQTISETFQCPVANGYGGRDSGFIAHECPAGGMHITADRLIVEIVDDSGRPLDPGQLGEIVVIHLDTPEMPFIRYRTGDTGALSPTPCSCGRGLPLLDRVEGRKTDFIVAPDGRVMHGLSLIYVLRKIDGIETFRITQKALSEFQVDLVTNKQFARESEGEIRREFELRLRAPVEVRIGYPPALAVAGSGKFRYVISELGEQNIALGNLSN
ncbi:MAG TPA: phenylacetate--CoA ligase family protein [Candidatus Binatia bacterium]|nr:phenylacetate--CoA ligase family protein [Candidatus Binatia bacterium]